MDRSYRIRTNISSDSVLNVNLKQDFDFLEILSLKLRQEDAYRLHSSNYGVIIGRVLANDAFGIPNAKVSVFIERDDSDSNEIESLYPYTEITSRDDDGRRYNLLPDYSDDDCYRVVGTFPNKRLILDDNTYMEVFDKYWKYTTVTNQAGDYIIFGVPTGSQELHVDIDLSDIGVLSQKPRDFEYKGYNLSMFDNPNQFKESTNLDGLAQLFSQNQSVFVYPFWGDADNGIAAITRSDIQIQYKFEPTCVFMGAIVSDNEGHSIGHKCSPDKDNGLNNQLVTGNGTIEMIRKTVDGLVEEYQIQGNQLIDEDGVWCYQIPMNLDYIGTDEYGNIVPTDNPSKGIPTRTQVRFRFSKTETEDEGFSRHTAKYLVPQNPIFDDTKVIPTIAMPGTDVEKMYVFGSATPDWCFRDLYWNNVYSVKNFIPRTQVASRAASHNYTGLKGSNLADDQNPIPFNKLRIDMPFMYIIVCLLFTIIMMIITMINGVICVVNVVLEILAIVKKIIAIIPIVGRTIAKVIPSPIKCLRLEGGLTAGNTVYFPGCVCKTYGDCPKDMEGCTKSTDNDDLLDNVQRSLALEHNIVKLDFYQDWLNGTLYMPLWHWRKRKKKTFLFGLFSSKAKSEYCSCEKSYGKLRSNITCNIEYEDNSLSAGRDSMPTGEKRWQSYRQGLVRFRHGLIKPVENRDGLTAYYYSAVDARSDIGKNPSMAMEQRPANFEAVRLFATDIILLGNLNEENLYGIPQFFTCLPSTTANIPPIATVEESMDDIADEEEGATSDASQNAEDIGTTLTTGMDWGESGGVSPSYYKGLFMDLACTVAYTRAKSCVNVERLSELGVNLDMTFDSQYSQDGTLQSGTFQPDGMISKIELDDNDNRAMFATLNHIGFIPQTYQDSIGSYQTQVNDKNTNYLVNKFKYLYPVDFDGRMQQPMNDYKGSFKQSMYDEQDQSYITFRLGAEADDSEGRVRHFYINRSNKYSMPLYNNSYYFYFGVNKGSTAIDKFNEKFYAQCFQNTKNPFTLDILSKGMSYCPSAYKNINDAYGYIKVVCDDIRSPYTYTLADSMGNVVVSESGMTVQGFVIGGKFETSSNLNSDIIPNDNGCIHYQIDDTIVREDPEDQNSQCVKIENQSYTLTLTDSDGKSISETVTIEIPQISAAYSILNLGTKFYSMDETSVSYMCNDDTEFYGKITISAITVDGYNCLLSNVGEISESDGMFTIPITGVAESNDDDNPLRTIEALLELRLISAESAVDNLTLSDCMCKEQGQVFTVNKPPFANWENGILELYVYQPCSISSRITQYCDGERVNSNSTSSTLNVRNGDNFIANLNSMPTRFMLGTTSSVPTQSNFYSSSVESNPVGGGLIGWYHVGDEEYYLMPNVDSANQKTWADYIDVTEINSIDAKRAAIRYKFNSMFSLAEAVYVTSQEEMFNLTVVGGVQPTLYRMVSPMFQSLPSQQQFVLSDNSIVSSLSEFPYIVGNNYSGATEEERPQFNPIYKTNYVGTYFGAFSNDGGYISKNEVDPEESVLRLPSYATVSPHNTLKTKGRDISGNISSFERAYNTMNRLHPNDPSRTYPYLRAMTIDRRLDYNIVIFAPSISSNFTLHTSDIENIWKGGRVSGTTYNGIEMAYDELYNIISANTADDLTSTSSNNVLEYTYRYTGEMDPTPITIWNAAPTTKRRFYEALFSGIDIRDYFWSEFNQLTPNGATEIPHIFDHRGDNTLYNGVFSESNYPTKRLIDIGNIPAVSNFDFSITSCGFGNSVDTDESGNMTCEAKEVDGINMNCEFVSPIEFINPNSDNKNYANITYSSKRKVGDYWEFSGGRATLTLRYTNIINSNFTIYTSVPKIIRVLPTIQDGLDGISYYKSAETMDAVTDRINDITIFRDMSFSFKYPEGISNRNRFMTKNGDEVTDARFYRRNGNNGAWVSSDESDFTGITLTANSVNLSQTTVFTLLFVREYWFNDDDYLSRRIRTIENCELIDCRPIWLMEDHENSYVMKEKQADGDVNVDVPIEGTDESGGTTTSNAEGTGSTEIYQYIQVLSFKISTQNGSNEPSDMLNQIFDDYNLMSFSFQFSSRFGQNYYVDNVTVTSDIDDSTDPNAASSEITLTVIWPQEMGYLNQPRWNSLGCDCTIFAKTQSGFVYKIGSFRIKASRQTLPSEVGGQEPTNFSIS